MRKPSFISALVLCAYAGGCSPEQAAHVVPDIPTGDRPPAIAQQLAMARSRVQQDPESAEAMGRFAMVLQAYGMHPQAEAGYARARQLAPGEFRWAYLHGFVLDVLGRDAQAREAFAAAARIDPESGNTLLGAALYKLGETEAAREKLREALAFNERNPRALYELGRLASADGSWDLAEEYLSKSLAAGSEHPSIFYVLAEVMKQQGKDVRAAEYFERFSASSDSGGTWPDRWLAEVASLRVSDRPLLDAAVRAIQKGDIAGAIRFNEQARVVNPVNPLPAAALIGLYAITGDNEKSEQALEAARQLDPDSAQFHYNVGLARIAQSRFPEAIKAMRRVTAIDPQGSLAWIKLGDIYALQGKRDEAIEAFAKAYERTPANQELRLKLGVLYVESQRYQAGLETLAAPAEGDFFEARRLWALGRAQRHLGNLDQATQALDKARETALRIGDGRLAAAVTGELERLNAADAD